MGQGVRKEFAEQGYRWATAAQHSIAQHLSQQHRWRGWCSSGLRASQQGTAACWASALIGTALALVPAWCCRGAYQVTTVTVCMVRVPVTTVDHPCTLALPE